MRHMREKYEKESLKQADLINRLENDIQQLKSQRDNKNLTAEMKRKTKIYIFSIFQECCEKTKCLK